MLNCIKIVKIIWESLFRLVVISVLESWKVTLKNLDMFWNVIFRWFQFTATCSQIVFLISGWRFKYIFRFRQEVTRFVWTCQLIGTFSYLWHQLLVSLNTSCNWMVLFCTPELTLLSVKGSMRNWRRDCKGERNFATSNCLSISFIYVKECQ